MNRIINFNEKTGLFLTKICGSMPFFWSILMGYFIWMVFNTIAPNTLRFDGQWFPLLLFISNFIQLIFLPILQVGQNYITKKADERAENQYKMITQIEELSIKIETLIESHNNIEDALFKKIDDEIIDIENTVIKK